MRRLAFAFSIIIAGTALFAQADLQPLAIVKYNKSETITLKQLKDRVGIYERQIGKQLSVEDRKQILESLIDQKLVVQAAYKAGMNITDSQVNQYFLQQMGMQFGRMMTEQELEQFAKANTGKSFDALMKENMNMTVREYKTFLKEQLLSQQYIISKNQNQIASAAPTDKEIRDYFDLNKAKFVRSDMLKLFLCVIPKGDNPAAAEKKARSLYDDFKSKKVNFEQMTKNSREKDSGYHAGTMFVLKTEQHAMLLGFSSSDMKELFDKKINDISNFNTTENDYQFYTVLNKYAGKMLSLSDEVQPESTVTVYDFIKNNLTQVKQQQALGIAAQTTIQSLNVKENVDRKKTGSELDSLLNWK